MYKNVFSRQIIAIYVMIGDWLCWRIVHLNRPEQQKTETITLDIHLLNLIMNMLYVENLPSH